jgi:hypothetical protein
MKCLHIALVALLLTGCVASQEQVSSPGCPAPAPAAEEASLVDPMYFEGVWEGQGCQSDGPCWTVRVALTGDEQGQPTGTVAYPSDHCKARLEFVRWEEGDVAAFRERFANPGKCVDNGWLRLKLLDTKKLSFVWAHPDGRIDAGTTLYRSR